MQSDRQLESWFGKVFFQLYLYFLCNFFVTEFRVLPANGAGANGVEMTVEELIKNAENGDPEAQFELANLLVREGGDPETIVQLFSEAAEQGHFRAMTNLGIIYYFGDFGEQSYERAASFF